MKLKKLFAAALIAVTALSLAGCDGDDDGARINGKHYDPYGLVNEDAVKDPDIKYEIGAVNVIIAAVLCETVIVPIYVVGWDLYEPVREK